MSTRAACSALFAEAKPPDFNRRSGRHAHSAGTGPARLNILEGSPFDSLTAASPTVVAIADFRDFFPPQSILRMSNRPVASTGGVHVFRGCAIRGPGIDHRAREVIVTPAGDGGDTFGDVMPVVIVRCRLGQLCVGMRRRSSAESDSRRLVGCRVRIAITTAR